LKAIWLIADKRKPKMAQHHENNPIYGAAELLKTNGFDALAEAVSALLNSAMVAERTGHSSNVTQKADTALSRQEPC
jgi:hypothetical protein